ncbi:50S ribosomal protein L9 [Parasphaerochaeta coccoides]|uniref:Large ribosomal subunit protein bL9 n=1 Tax=Parasphaerochaeta coccoides (strain ATCC BAA-1237 / DSM 17374 / SPN1) TaxID=760011 RepID=F4GLF4_PARC1|nr:50S ribosomal protein L9 [Parasphaerochaeta coccoides]AEC01924.1 50S ribosomal protein L9 [Parasphaerochaeta coccoides DSM 17374]
MKIILNQDVPNLGEEGDVRVVKDGYARNYLIPTGAAVLFNRANEALFADRAAAIEKRKVQKRYAARTLKERIDSLTLTVVVAAGESGKLFGSVTSSMVQDLLAKEGIEIERKKLEVPTHAIKTVGTYSIAAHLYESENAQFSLVVESDIEVKKREAAARQAEEDKARVAAAEAKKAAKIAADEAAVKAAEADKEVVETEEAVDAAADEATGSEAEETTVDEE